MTKEVKNVRSLQSRSDYIEEMIEDFGKDEAYDKARDDDNITGNCSVFYMGSCYHDTKQDVLDYQKLYKLGIFEKAKKIKNYAKIEYDVYYLYCNKTGSNNSFEVVGSFDRSTEARKTFAQTKKYIKQHTKDYIFNNGFYVDLILEKKYYDNNNNLIDSNNTTLLEEAIIK